MENYGGKMYSDYSKSDAYKRHSKSKKNELSKYDHFSPGKKTNSKDNHRDISYKTSDSTTTSTNSIKSKESLSYSDNKYSKEHNKYKSSSKTCEGSHRLKRYRSRTPLSKIRDSKSRSRSCDSRRSDSSFNYEEDCRRSRSRERKRICQQNLTIKRYCQTSEGQSQVFWDGFQWVNKENGLPGYDQQMNATRRARRLHIGNLPLFMNINENDFRDHLWRLLRENKMSNSYSCPILHIWFARDRGGNFGFMEMSTVEDAHIALKMDGFVWHGVPIRINRPTDWKKSISSEAIDVLASTSGLAVAESLAAAAQQAAITGNSNGLVSLVSQLPQDQQKAVVEVMNQHVIPSCINSSSVQQLPPDLMIDKIRTDLLSGAPSRSIVVHKPCLQLNSLSDYQDVLTDIIEECSKHGSIMSAIILTPERKERTTIGEVGDVFLEFATSAQADNCILNMGGRIFEGRPVKMSRFDDSMYTKSLKLYAENLFIKKFKETTGL